MIKSEWRRVLNDIRDLAKTDCNDEDAYWVLRDILCASDSLEREISKVLTLAYLVLKTVPYEHSETCRCMCGGPCNCWQSLRWIILEMVGERFDERKEDTQ